MKACRDLALPLHSFVTAAPNGGEWSASRLGHFNPREVAQFHTDYETGWAPEPVRTFRREQSLDPTGIGTPYRPARSLVTTLRPYANHK